MIGACFFFGSWASGTASFAAPFFGVHCCAPAGLLVSSHSWLNRFSKKALSHFTGLLVQAPSRPLVIVSGPLPDLNLLIQPKPCASMPAASGSGPQYSAALAAPWA